MPLPLACRPHLSTVLKESPEGICGTTSWDIPILPEGFDNPVDVICIWIQYLLEGKFAKLVLKSYGPIVIRLLARCTRLFDQDQVCIGPWGRSTSSPSKFPHKGRQVGTQSPHGTWWMSRGTALPRGALRRWCSSCWLFTMFRLSCSRWF